MAQHAVIAKRGRLRSPEGDLEGIVAEIRACRFCLETPLKAPLPHEPRPVLQVSRTARLVVCSQAPGTKVHASGRPFTDRSGERLRDWMGVTAEEFYDASRVAVVPMGFCFPGQDAKGADLPPRRECAPLWLRRLFAELPQIELILAVGSYAQKFHLAERAGASLQETVLDWRRHLGSNQGTRILPLPHPSWRNNAWLKKNPWFEDELVPALRAEVRALL